MPSLATSSLHRYRSTIAYIAVALVALASLIAGLAIIATAPSSSVVDSSASLNGAPTTPAPRATLAAYTLPATAAKVAFPIAGQQFTVVRGDTLSVISQEAYRRPACWPGVYRENERVIGANPNIIEVGQHLVIPAACSTRPVYTPTPQTAVHTTDVVSAQPVTVTSSFEACVITRESGGNAQIWNHSAHWGLFQFAYGTWVAAGGAPSLFGNADAAYQESVFWKAYELWGTSPWAPSDGC